MSVIDDIYNGAYYPAELVKPVSDSFHEHLQKAETLSKRLARGLDEEQNSILDEFKEESAILTDLYNLEFYRAGVKFGIRLLLEALGRLDGLPDVHK